MGTVEPNFCVFLTDRNTRSAFGAIAVEWGMDINEYTCARCCCVGCDDVNTDLRNATANDPSGTKGMDGTVVMVDTDDNLIHGL